MASILSSESALVVARWSCCSFLITTCLTITVSSSLVCNLLSCHFSTTLISTTEQQWIAWCVAFQTAIRPGSLGRGEASDRQEYSRLRDLDLSRGQERGRFNLILTIRILKTNTNNMEQGVKGKHVNIALDMPLTTPQAKENIIFSVPHRILAMLLRRGALEGITSVAELINGTQQNITVCHLSAHL